MRDITSNPEWDEAYGLVIPVLTHTALDGSQEVGARTLGKLATAHAD